MNEDIKPIPTFYNGWKFRSRLEARWAVFFDALEIKWIYEPESFDLSDVYNDNGKSFYIPDFFLPKQDMFVECKPTIFKQNEMRKCLALHKITGKNILLLSGVPENKTQIYIGQFTDGIGFGDVCLTNFREVGRWYWSAGCVRPFLIARGEAEHNGCCSCRFDDVEEAVTTALNYNFFGGKK
jgi:hypothetical protein